MGAHPSEGRKGWVSFPGLGASDAQKIAVMGEFNQWDPKACQMERITPQGIWQIFIPGIKEYTSYQYRIEDAQGNHFAKADPYGFHMETRPATASKTYDLDRYAWKDFDRRTIRKEPPLTRPDEYL